MLLVADIGDREPAARADCRDWFACCTQTMCCEPCRLFYSHCWLFWLEHERRVAQPSMVRWLVTTRHIIEAKIACDTAACCKNYYQLLKRLSITGHALSSAQIMTQIALQAVRLRMLRESRTEAEQARLHLSLRERALLRQMELLGRILKSERPACARRLRTALEGVALEPDAPGWARAYAAALHTLRHLEDGPEVDPAEMMARLRGAATSLHDWATATRFGRA